MPINTTFLNTSEADHTSQWFDRHLMHMSFQFKNALAGNYTKAYETWRRNQNIHTAFRTILSERNGESLKILDIGCGNGYHLFSLNARVGLAKHNLLGVDRDVLDLDFARKMKKYLSLPHINFESINDAQRMDFEDETFDVVLCAEVVEHLPEPDKCISEISRILKPGGFAVIATPNESNWMIRAGEFLKKINLNDTTSHVPTSSEVGEHISVYSVEQWVGIMEKVGLNCRKLMRGSPIFGGGDKYNKRRVLFALLMIVDKILDFMPFGYNLSENVTYFCHKKK